MICLEYKQFRVLNLNAVFHIPIVPKMINNITT